MEIIIHGKPTAGCSVATAGIDGSLSSKIVNDFFEGMNRIKDSQALIVEARYWKGAWYSVYTYQLGVNIKDMANRTSYFALSIVIPQKYCCLVSEVYTLLQRVIKTTIANTCIAGNGKYIVQDFSNPQLLNNVIQAIKNGYTNLEENFDNTFKPQAEFSNNIYYNVQDCDAKAFVEHLRNAGRVIVTETAETKDALLTKTNTYMQQCQKAQAELKTRTEELEKVKKELANVNNSAGNQLKQLQSQTNAFAQEKNRLEAENKILAAKVEKIAAVIGPSQTNAPITNTPPKKQEDNWLTSIPLINTALLILLGLIMLMKGCSGPQSPEYTADSKPDMEIESGKKAENATVQSTVNQTHSNEDDKDNFKDDPGFYLMDSPNKLKNYRYQNVANTKEIETVSKNQKHFKIIPKDAHKPAIVITPTDSIIIYPKTHQ